MKKIVFVAASLVLFCCASYAEDKSGQVKIDGPAKQGTVTTSKDGSWKVGVGALPPKTESMQTEQDRRNAQQDKGGQAFVKKEF